MAQILSLPEASAADTAVDQEVKRRVYWTLYMVDRWNSAGTRQLPDALKHPMPVHELEFHQPHFRYHASLNPGLWAYFISLASIFGEIQDLHRRHVSGELEDVQFEEQAQGLAARLEQFAEGLPTELRLNVDNVRWHADQGIGRTFVALHLGFHHYSTLIHFQYLDIQLPRTPKQRLFASRCKHHANTYSDLLKLSTEIPNCDAVYNIVGHMTVVSSMLLHILCFGEEEELPMARQRLEQNFQVLIRLRSYWPSVHKMMDRLFAFQTACMWTVDPNTHKIDKWMLKFLLQHAIAIGDKVENSAAPISFAQPVPKDLIDFIDGNWDTLTDAFRTNFKSFKTASKKQGTWEEVFGKSKKTDELFMAYHYALYLDRVASAGKEKYPIPLYTNVWQNYAGDDADNDFPTVVGGGEEPGNYPSGGGVVDVLDIWQHFTPSLDLVAPDVYLNDYASSCAKYRHRNQPLFIPEQRRDDHGARRVHQCLGTSPFGIDTQAPAANPFTRTYGLLARVAPIVVAAQRRPDSSCGFFFDELPAAAVVDPSPPKTATFSDWDLDVRRCFVFGKPGPGAGMKYVADGETGELRTLRNLNGDETRSGVYAIMPNEDPDYGGFPICVTIPARTMIAELELYSIEEEE
ncbi:hypothetical protein SLS58_006699 [Diplodia intermedia]|uniref:Transcription factor domain-containing protein n=1 Tax=Diplodia intermedia TaxID=856260 RepID=A0ABR3TMT4_9PEZI